MLASYHTHTYRCRHAFGSEEKYIKKAIAEDLAILGFADHAPMPYKNGHVSTYKMLPAQLDDYFDTLLGLREKYKNEIDIKIGLEAEYYPSIWEDSLALWSKYPLDYLILGQHFVPEESPDPSLYTAYPTTDDSRLSLYTDTIITAIETGKFSYVAHPDILNYRGDTEFYISEAQRLIRAAIEHKMPLEFNLLGMREQRNYPNSLFWNEVARLGAEAVVGCDSHSPQRVCDSGEVKMAERYLSDKSIKVRDRIELVNPFN